MQRKKRPRAGRVVRRTLADGTVREYRYAAYKPKRRAPSTDSLDALIRAYLRSPKWKSLKDQTRQGYAIYFRPLEDMGHIPASRIGRRELLMIRDGIATGRGNGAATGFMRAAAALFTWAVKNDWIDRSPVHHIEPIPGGELRAWTVEQAEMAQGALPEHLRRVVILARYTGQRRGDLCAMTWADFDGETIRVRQQKGGDELVIACHPALRAELVAWRSGTVVPLPTNPILTNTLGRPWRPMHLSHALPTALAQIGLPPDLNVHGLRKLAATELADAGCTTHEIAAVTGHRTLSMVQHYTRSADQRRLAETAVAKLSGSKNRFNRGSS